VAKGGVRNGECTWSSGVMLSFNSIGVLGGFFLFLTLYRKMGNECEMGNVFIFFIGVDLWLIFIFQGWEMGNVLESGIHIYLHCTDQIKIWCCEVH